MGSATVGSLGEYTVVSIASEPLPATAGGLLRPVSSAATAAGTAGSSGWIARSKTLKPAGAADGVAERLLVCAGFTGGWTGGGAGVGAGAPEPSLGASRP